MLIDFTDKNFLYSLLCIILAPTIWNILAQLELRKKLLTKLSFNNKYLGCYLLAIYIFSFSCFRDYLFMRVSETQYRYENYKVISCIVGNLLVIIGAVFASTSHWKLGITGTYLGDYFGIYMKKKIVGFPFNVINNPMYMGACVIFLGNSLRKRCPANFLLTLAIFIMYRLAILVEEPQTRKFYEDLAKKKEKYHLK